MHHWLRGDGRPWEELSVAAFMMRRSLNNCVRTNFCVSYTNLVLISDLRFSILMFSLASCMYRCRDIYASVSDGLVNEKLVQGR